MNGICRTLYGNCLIPVNFMQLIAVLIFFQHCKAQFLHHTDIHTAVIADFIWLCFWTNQRMVRHQQNCPAFVHIWQETTNIIISPSVGIFMPGTYYFFTIFRSIPILQIFHIRMSRQIWTMEMTEYNLYAFIIHHILHCISLPLRTLIPLFLRTFQNQICILASYHRRRRWRTASRFYFIKYPTRIPAVTVVTVTGVASPHTYISTIFRNFQYTHIPNHIANIAVLPLNCIRAVWCIYIMIQYAQWFFCIL